MQTLKVKAGQQYTISFKKELLEDYVLVHEVGLESPAEKKKGRSYSKDWSGVACNPGLKLLFHVNSGTQKIRVTDYSGQIARGQDIKTQGFSDLEDLVYVGQGDNNVSVFYGLEEKRWRLVRLEIGRGTSTIKARDCELWTMAGAPGGPGLGKTDGGDTGLEGLAYDPDGQRLLVAKEKPPRIYAVPLKSLPSFPRFPLQDEVGKLRAGDDGNLAADVQRVQRALTAHGQLPAGFTPGHCDERTIQAIEDFQRKIGLRSPDGLIEPGKRTHRGLMGLGFERNIEGVLELTDTIFSGQSKVLDISGLCYRNARKKTFGFSGDPRDFQRLLILSHESQVVLEVPVHKGTAALVSRLSLKAGAHGLAAGVLQAEGLAMDSAETLYITSAKSNRLYVFKKKSRASETLDTSGRMPATAPTAASSGGAAGLAVTPQAEAQISEPLPQRPDPKPLAIPEKPEDEQDYSPVQRDFQLKGKVVWKGTGEPTAEHPEDLEKVRKRLAELGYQSPQLAKLNWPTLARHASEMVAKLEGKESKTARRYRHQDAAYRLYPAKAQALSSLELLQNEVFGLPLQKGSKEQQGVVTPGSLTHLALLRPIALGAPVSGAAAPGIDVQRVKERLWAFGKAGITWADLNQTADGKLDTAIRSFQQAMGLGADGVLGVARSSSKLLNGDRQPVYDPQEGLRSDAVTAHGAKPEHILQGHPRGAGTWEGGWSCNPTSMAMLLRYFKPEYGRGMSDFELMMHCAQLGGVTPEGSSYVKCKKMLEAVGLRYQMSPKRGDTSAWITEQLRAGAIICTGGSQAGQKWNDRKGGHWMLITGIDKDGALMCNDPGTGGPRSRAMKPEHLVEWLGGEVSSTPEYAVYPG